MPEINKLFVCSQCGNSIAPQMDNLDLAKNRMEVLIREIEQIKKLLETSQKENGVDVK